MKLKQKFMALPKRSKIMVAIVLPAALAGAVAFLVAISPITTAVSVVNGSANAINATTANIAKLKADIAAEKAKLAKQRAAQRALSGPH